MEVPELPPDEPDGHVPPEQVPPITVQSAQVAPFVPQAVSPVPLTQLPFTSQQPVQDRLHATPVSLLLPLLASLLPPSSALLPLSSPLPLLPLPDDDPPDATNPSSPGLAVLEAPPPPLDPKPVPTLELPPPHA